MESSIDAAGLNTTYAYDSDQRTTTVTFPGNAVQITTRHVDGRTASVTGTAGVAQYYSYGVNPDGSQWTEVRTGAPNSPMYQRTITDMLGRTIHVEKQGYSSVEAIQNYYDTQGRLVRTFTNGQADTLYIYDELGNVVQSGLDIDANGVLEPASMDRINANETLYTKINDQWWQQTTTQVYPLNNNGTAVTLSIQRNQLTGLIDDGQASESVSIDIHGNITTMTSVVDRTAKTITQNVNYPDSAIDGQTISINGLTVQNRTKTGVITTYSYDALGRRTQTTDPRTGTSTIDYNNFNQVDWIEDAAGNRMLITIF
jgi:YD repeat-containing protein